MSAIEDGYERLYAYVMGAVESDREPHADWRLALHDVAVELDRIVRRAAHPDDVMHARSAMSNLAGVWLSVEEGEEVWMGGRDSL